MGMIFTNKAWDHFIHGKSIHGKRIDLNSKYRIPPEYCERWYNQDNRKTSIAKPCKNKAKVRSNQTGIYFCFKCANTILKINKDFGKGKPMSFTKL